MRLKFRLWLFRMLLKPYVKQGRTYLLRRFYSELIWLHEDEFPEEDKHSLKEFIKDELDKTLKGW